MQRNNNPDYDYLFKVRVIGAKNSGKSNLILKFADNVFYSGFISTLGVHFKNKTINTDNKKIKFQIWDTEASQQSRSYHNTDLRGVHAIIVTVDMTNKQSFKELKYYLDEISRFACETAKTIIVATKMDEDELEVNIDELISFCRELNIPVTCISSRTGYNVEMLFHNCAKLIINDIGDENVSVNSLIEQELVSAITNYNFIRPQYLCLSLLQGKDQEKSIINKLPNDVFHNIFKFMTRKMDGDKFAHMVFGRKMQLDVKRFVDVYSGCPGLFKTPESISFVENMHSICIQKPDQTTEFLIKKSITNFVENKMKDPDQNSKAVALLIQHGLHKPAASICEPQNKSPCEDKTQENCVIS